MDLLEKLLGKETVEQLRGKEENKMEKNRKSVEEDNCKRERKRTCTFLPFLRKIWSFILPDWMTFKRSIVVVIGITFVSLVIYYFGPGNERDCVKKYLGIKEPESVGLSAAWERIDKSLDEDKIDDVIILLKSLAQSGSRESDALYARFILNKCGIKY